MEHQARSCAQKQGGFAVPESRIYGLKLLDTGTPQRVQYPPVPFNGRNRPYISEWLRTMMSGMLLNSGQVSGSTCRDAPKASIRPYTLTLHCTTPETLKPEIVSRQQLTPEGLMVSRKSGDRGPRCISLGSVESYRVWC